jgi:hemolysin activation/secretion protein
MSGSLPIIHEEPHPPVAPSPQAGRVGEGFFYYGCLTGHDITPDSLLSLEKFSIGGVDTVRGYRQNQLVADNGILGAIELRIPVTKNPRTLQLTPFFEVGTGWNNRSENPDPSFIASLGLGMEWQVFRGLDVRLDYGIPLVGVKDKGDSLQDNGFNFSLRYQPF